MEQTLQGRFSPMSETSTDRSENMNHITVTNNQDYVNVVNKKKLVLNEIKQNYITKQNSDSERENEISKEVDMLDWYGKTPPREIRRIKQKFCGNIGLKKNIKKTNSGQYSWQKYRDDRRKEKLEESFSDEITLSDLCDVPRTTKLVRVNSSKSLKSLSQQRPIVSSNKEDDTHVIKRKVVSQAIHINTRKQRDTNTTSSRHHFFNTFSLLVKLGGRRSQDLKDGYHDETDNDQHQEQVEFQELLWLELQAWHHGQSIEEHDNFLEEARQKIDQIIDEVIDFKFVECQVENDDLNSDGSDSDNEFLMFECLKEFNEVSTPVMDQQVRFQFNNLLQPIQDEEAIDLEAPRQKTATSDLGFRKFESCLEKNDKENGILSDESCKEICDRELHKTKSEQVEAMLSVMDILKKVNSIEQLYPSIKALTMGHPKYKDVKFVRNTESLNLWLSISKDMFHKLNVLAELIDIDPDDLATWKDWFDIGLDIHCLKTNQSYRHQHCLSTSDMLEGSGNLGVLSNNYALRRSKRDKRKQSSVNRLSIIEKTSTSRYRSFVEKGVRQGGLLGLIKRLKDILSATLWKARLTLTEQQGNSKSALSDRDVDMKKVVTMLQKYSASKDVLYTDVEVKKSFAGNNKWGKACQEMCLPSFLNHYLFLIKVPFDVVHECIRFRLDYKPKVEPSQHSIRQLISECKEVVCGGVGAKHYYLQMTNAVLSTNDAESLKHVETSLEEFDDDLKSMINMYFDYLQSWFTMQKKMKDASEKLKNVLEEEWAFVKDICPYVHSGEARASYKFCVFVSDLMKSTGHYLETSVDKCISLYNPKEDGESLRQKMQSACRFYKEMVKEVRGRTTQGINFAKTLIKDLGVAASYKILAPFENVLTMLKKSGHQLLECPYSTYFIFIPPVLTKNKRECIELISLIYGFENADGNSFCPGRYILIVRKPSNHVIWTGQRLSFDISNEITLALSHIHITDGLTLVCKNSYHLNSQRKDFERLLDNALLIKKEHTSSHGIIEQSLLDILESTKNLASIITTSVQHINENLSLDTNTEMDEADRNLTHKTCIETIHFCFSLGFDYLREMIRLFHGQNRLNLGPLMLDFARTWINFVMTRTEKGRGTRPRWAAQGMEFLLTAIEPRILQSLSEIEFNSLKSKMNDCIAHIVGQAVPKQKKTLKARSSSPYTVRRSRSVPNKTDPNESLVANENRTKSFTMPAEFLSSKAETHQTSIYDDNNSASTSSIFSDSDTQDSLSNILEEDNTDEQDGLDIPIIRVRSALQEIDERRTAKLQHMRVIGIVTNKTPNLATQLVNMNVRRVNFKWRLGNKIGEGQFGKVYSAVNLDTGELMAVKQVRFNPYDYGTIQDIADEITNIQFVQHECLVRYYGVEVHKDEMLIFMENCSDGTIAEVAKLGLPESMVRVYTYQITKAINFLHQNGVVHRDIKGANIFLSSSGLIKIGDFGSAVKLKDPMCTTIGEVFNTRGTAAYMAPEVITLDKGKGYGRAADIWSLGCVVIEMVTGKQPWSDYDNIYAIMYKVGDGQHPTIPENLSDEGVDFLRRCFIQNPIERWTAHMLEDHPFVKFRMLNKKIICKHTSSSLKEYQVKEQLEDFLLAPHDVLIKINSCGLSLPPDKILKKFCKATSNELPVGRDISGTIEAIGSDVSHCKVEQDVTSIIPLSSCQSGCASYCSLSEYDVVVKPDKVSHVDAACGIGDAVKAYTALLYQAKITSGETVVIASAAKGFGVIATQLAKYWGAKVIALASSDEEITFLKSMEPRPGIVLLEQVIDLRNKRKNITSVCMEETGGIGIDCFIDDGVEMYSEEFADGTNIIEKKLLTKHDVISSLSVGGRWVTTQHDLQVDPPDSELLTLKCASMHYLFEDFWTLSKGSHGRYMHVLRDIMDKMAAGILRPSVHHTVLLEDCISNLENLHKSKIGKIVVKL